MTQEALVSLIVAVLGLIFKTIQEQKEKQDAAIKTKLEALRKPLAENDAAGIHAALSDQHDRMQQAIRSYARK